VASVVGAVHSKQATTHTGSSPKLQPQAEKNSQQDTTTWTHVAQQRLARPLRPKQQQAARVGQPLMQLRAAQGEDGVLTHGLANLGVRFMGALSGEEGVYGAAACVVVFFGPGSKGFEGCASERLATSGTIPHPQTRSPNPNPNPTPPPQPHLRHGGVWDDARLVQCGAHVTVGSQIILGAKGWGFSVASCREPASC